MIEPNQTDIVFQAASRISDLETERDNLLQLLEDHRQRYASKELELIEVTKQRDEALGWYRECVRECEKLRAQLIEERELRVMQLAAITTASLQNTEESLKERITSGNPYYSEAYAHACRAVDREMALRRELERCASFAEDIRKVL
jgi:septal ring factor EnvC (AmiA/AmiB activator)